MSMIEEVGRAITHSIENGFDRLCDYFPRRRERIATALYAAMLSNPDQIRGRIESDFAKASLSHADALIAELDK